MFTDEDGTKMFAFRDDGTGEHQLFSDDAVVKLLENADLTFPDAALTSSISNAAFPTAGAKLLTAADR